ncbi:glycoside hydrolase family 1 protein [Lacticaseibacillus saniviri]|nr:glycoside hydrolase family 1 protein [Lacticaseibacillus saniviri]MCG4281572.1 glycoside hydrolase family 1 protein [Lacticaseibacillus saniviri]
MTLPDNFLWGNSTSSMQTEGANLADGKGASVYDMPGANPIWATAIDDYHRYPEDIALMDELGMNCYRFQISWSRVQPDGEGAFNEAGIQFYADLIDQLLAKGIEPMICLYHFDLPLALAEKYDGFGHPAVTDAFVRYAHEMLTRFSDKVTYWLTFNEQNLYGMPGAAKIAGVLHAEEDDALDMRIQHQVALAHARVSQDIHAHFPGVKLGAMIAYQQPYAASPLPDDAEVARVAKAFWDTNVVSLMTGGGYVPEVAAWLRHHGLTDLLNPTDLATLAAAKSDFMSFSYYSSIVLSANHIPLGTAPSAYAVGVVPNPTLRANEWQWQVDPLGFKAAMLELFNQTELPLFPIENGIGVDEVQPVDGVIQDTYRIDYHRTHLQMLKDVVEQNDVPVIGYLGWGLIDIPSSQGNMKKRYGVVYVDRTNTDVGTLKRTKKASFDWLARAIKSNGREL